ncbi:hypothetical protein SPRG_20194 [Saprolegnia parasitica CBS 223.65]|uniref:Uncharacterized protein n=1 Tax=Saprolegnia parasitica (strain CBS 223.65) TaxID=695850 RepID=A0A067CBZ8_SAPPC|nr:hypothetical protein SPRG_20194 [Saprolegnia parasitica CBS 223.65]KDO28033.1 hypothetical protein SPRG_20194 [Saprolegnia parasitica CBS 223.65]|eukprot:XP_012201186.1 hypothetical protein SPRG_20194 [Saprolegnia parasitica CBS 223.65]
MEFAAMTRTEQKAMLKAWNAKAARMKEPKTSSNSPINTTGMQEVLKQATVPSDSLTSVAAIQASYRGRQRVHEIASEALVKRTNQYRKWLLLKEENRLKRTPIKTISSTESAHDDKLDTTPKESVVEDTPGDTSLEGTISQQFGYAQFAREAGFKDHLIATVRSDLVTGKVVQLSIDMDKTGDSLSDARLVLQQVCVASLLYCDRNQDMVPRVIGSVVSISLTPKLSRD